MRLTLELQITHPDDDHIGNAIGFLKRMCDTNNIKYIRGSRVVYCQIPPLYCTPTIEAQSPIEFGKIDSQDVNATTYTGKISKRWGNKMEKAGFDVMVEVFPVDPDFRDYTIAKNNVQWDDNTRNGNTSYQCTVAYNRQAAKDNFNFDLAAEITIFLPKQGDLIANVVLKSKTNKKKVTTTWYESTVSRDKSALTSLDVPVSLSDDQIKNKLRGEYNQTISKKDWVDPPSKKQKISAPFSLAKVMSRMVVTETPTPEVLSLGIVRSVRQVLDLSDTIQALNADATLNPSLREVIPTIGSLSSTRALRKTNNVLHQG